MKKYFIFLFLFVFQWSFLNESVQASVNITPEVVGVIANSMYRPNVTYPEWSTVSGNYLYHGSNWGNTMSIVDISDPLNPIELSSLHDGDTGATIKSPKGSMVVGDYLYFINWNNATGDESVEILNVADKSNPYHVANYIFTTGTGDKTYSLFVKDDYIYIATAAGNKLIILEARDKENISQVGSISNGSGGAQLNWPYGVHVVGDYAFVTSYTSDSLEVVNVSDKSNPTHHAALLNGSGGAKLDGASAIQIVGDYAYIMSRNSKALEIVNISNPATPTHVSSITNGTNGAKIWGYELSISGNYAYLSSYDSNAISVVNISNPAAPTHVGVISDGEGGSALQRPRAISYYNGTIYVSVTGSNRIEIIDVSNPATPTHINQIDPSLYLGGARFVKVRDGLAYVTSNVSNGLQIIDVSNPKNPTPKGSATLRVGGAQLFGPLGLDLRGDYVYIVSTGANFGGGGTSATWGALEIMNISDPDNPVHVNSIVGGVFSGSYTGGAQDIKIIDDYAYITVPSRRAMLIFDIGSNPENPVLVGSIFDGSGGAYLVSPFGIDVVGNYAYITASSTLQIIDISNPTSPSYTSSLSNGSGGALLSTGRFIKVVGNYAYIAASGSNALEIVDISNPAAPVHAGALVDGSDGAMLKGAYGISVLDGRAYVGSANSNAVEVIDVANPALPTHLYSITDGQNGARLISPRGLDNDGEFVYATAYNGSSNSLNIIRVKATAPTDLSYESSNFYTKNKRISPLNPSVSGKDLLYSISPELPSGLSISSSSGIISGTPTVVATKKTYTVTATNSAGSTSFSLVIAVNDISSAPLVLPSSIGSGIIEKTIEMKSVDNIGRVGVLGTNLLAYINSQAIFEIPVSSKNWETSSEYIKISDLDLYKNVITIDYSAGKENVSLKNGESALIDIDRDGIKDFSLTFVGTYVNRAEVTIKSLESKNIENSGENDSLGQVINTEKEENNLNIEIVKENNNAKQKEEETKINFLFSKNLRLGSFNSDVKELQKFLNSSNYQVSTTGLGSKGKETSFFGQATKAALIKFQKANNIEPALGFFGPITRKVVNNQ